MRGHCDGWGHAVLEVPSLDGFILMYSRMSLRSSSSSRNMFIICVKVICPAQRQ
jgi:hypothetical protein